MLTAKTRVAILLEDGIKGNHGKTGLAFLRYSDTDIVAIIDRSCAGESLAQLTQIDRHIPIVADTKAALVYQPDVLLIGIAPSGGKLPASLEKEIKIAVDAGVSIINGLHTLLEPKYPNLQPQQWIWDIRQEPPGLSIGTAKVRSLLARRILTVGTDMAIGKMSTSLEIHRAAKIAGIKANFVATGQAGIAIAGKGIALDAVRVDFAAGAVEKTVMNAAEDNELIIIEGQGSLLHPGSTATLPLIRGSQPTGLILVHRAGAKHIRDLPDVSIPPLPEVIKLYETVASAGGTFGEVKVKAIALNTFGMDEDAANQVIQSTQELTGLPCSDVVRFGGKTLLSAITAN
ncbi:DUF1611 domain-containing protein [Waterburya agarophytonicola K14]|uniref:DUF1611 domain-containing protein n=1 Tax=Waterburya agarophytonicola KI4 TaxID=2874699 RepID=A0A964BP35_9CYAN|nr:DUF1611 domain-containing protein [Waterburya agarophytonicola]MCC0176974.1 DUF1611 domain-containing protein [Waterburya agarophytonicola KI4]